jgi:hypothetical protein
MKKSSRHKEGDSPFLMHSGPLALKPGAIPELFDNYEPGQQSTRTRNPYELLLRAVLVTAIEDLHRSPPWSVDRREMVLTAMEWFREESTGEERDHLTLDFVCEGLYDICGYGPSATLIRERLAGRLEWLDSHMTLKRMPRLVSILDRQE